MEDEKKKKICPLRFVNGVPQPCLEDECAWWVKWLHGEPECIIQSLSYLADMT